MLLCSVMSDEVLPAAGLRPISLRAALIGACLAAYLPRPARKLVFRSGAVQKQVRVEAEFTVKPSGERIRAECTALVDTGNMLFEPMTALPVIVLDKERFRQAAALARLPIPVRTACGTGVIYCARPSLLLINGRPADALIAFSSVRTAIAPPCVVRDGENTA